MTDLFIKLGKHLDGDRAFAACEIFDASGELVREFSVPVGYAAEPAKIQLEPGPYLVRARLPSGHTVSKQITIDATEPTIEVLDASGSQYEWLSWHHYGSGEAAIRRT